MRVTLVLSTVLTLVIGTSSASAAPGKTVEYTDPAAFEAATKSRVSIGFDRILPPGLPFQSFNPLDRCGLSFTTPNTNTFVNVTRADYYAPSAYRSDFIVDSANVSPDNRLVISLKEPSYAVAIEYGGLGFSGPGFGIITLSNGHVFSATLPTVGKTNFIGFIAGEPIATLTLVTRNDSWVLTRVIVGDTSKRAAVDRHDNAKDKIHIMYVLPCDGVDERLDTEGVIGTSVEAFQRWLERETGGRRLRVDQQGQNLDITFLRLGRTDLELASHGVFLRDELEREIHDSGFNEPDKVYAVYYGGHSTVACGGAPWPPALVGNVAALYLLGEPPGAPPCNSNPFASSFNEPGYLEFAMLHEIVHSLGFVATCAPNHTRAGHVSDDPRDLMYAGNLPWQPSILDIGRDDYFGHFNGGCLDMQDSSFLTPAKSRR